MLKVCLFGQWYCLVGTYDGSSSSNGIKLYLNGLRVDDTVATLGTYTAMENSPKPLYIGKYGTQYLDGMVDEVRISNTVRSSNWIQTSYNNQNNPHGFHNIGDQENLGINTVMLNSPVGDTISQWTINFSFTPQFIEPIQKAELYTNESGSWDVVETIYSVTSNISNNITHIFPHIYPYPEEGTYIWSVCVWNSTDGIFASFLVGEFLAPFADNHLDTVVPIPEAEPPKAKHAKKK